MENLHYPSKVHEEYIKDLYSYCSEHSIGLYITGSVAKGNVHAYSDIDIVLVSKTYDEHIEDLIDLYLKPIMKYTTQNPKGILIMIYDNGLCVDMDMRNSISNTEANDMYELVPAKSEIISCDNINRRCNLAYTLFNSDTPGYNESRLFHRSLLKYLSGKKESALNLLNEIKKTIPDFNETGIYTKDISELFTIYNSSISLSEEYIDLIVQLINKTNDHNSTFSIEVKGAEE